MRALARKPEDRFPSAEAMAAVLGRLRRPDRTEPIPVIRDAAPPAVEGTDRSFFRSWLLVPLLVVLSVAALIGIGLAVGLLETGGPIGIQPADDAPDSPAQAEAYAPAEVMSFDPEGDGEENPDLVVLAHDGHVDTWWETQSYDLNPPGRTGLRVASQGIDKSGVGLLVDLGATHEVVGFVLRSPFPGWTFELRVGDDADVLATTTGPPFTSRSNQRVLLDEPIEGRFVLLWATSVVSAGNDHLATVAELQVLGPGG